MYYIWKNWNLITNVSNEFDPLTLRLSRQFRSRATTSLIYNRISYFWRIHFLHMTLTYMYCVNSKIEINPMFAWAFLENCFKSNYLALALTLSLMFWTFCKTSSKLFFISNFLKFQTISVHKFIFFSARGEK